jgi:hypothetical protein
MMNRAEEAWSAFPDTAKQVILHNVWCGNCRGSTEIIGYEPVANGKSLVLEGVCSKCGHRVARVVDDIHLD